MILNENLRAGDLKNLVRKIIEIDSHKSKIGNDEDIVVLSFTVTDQEPAKDLENFIEMGYEFVLDADVSTGELDDGTYKVYVEIERSKKIANQIMELLYGIEKITNINDFRFRYFKSFKSKKIDKDSLSIIPTTPDDYKIATERLKKDNFSNFFTNSFSDTIGVLDENIKFKRTYKEPLSFKIVESGTPTDLYASLTGNIQLDVKDIAEIMYLTKSIGDYNITKLGNYFIFENNGWAVALEKM